ncbi:hypothetical protein ACWEVP_04125 [Amycolatopsis sp. NPDC003865]
MVDANLLLSKRFREERPGLTLLGIEKAAVPVTIVAADILAQEVKALPLLDEFVLRLTKANVRGAAEIAAFLGLEQDLVNAVVADHYRQGALEFGPALGQLTLTGRGRRLADELESIRPVQKTFKLAFDRLTWRVADYEPRDLMTKRVALAEGYLLLPAQRTTRIKTSDVTPSGVNAILRPPGRDVKIDVLDVNDVTPSTHRYMPVEMLIYGDPDRGEVETAVVLDGDPSEAHESVLNTLGGPAGLGFRVVPTGPAAPLPPHLGVAREKVDRGPQPEGGTPFFREIRLFEHQIILMTALEEATDRLLIVTDGATRSVVDATFLGKLEQALKRNVQTDLVFPREDGAAERDLDQLARRYHNRLRIHHTTDDHHGNALIYDGIWVVSDFPWLAFRGGGRPFRAYSGTVVAIPEEVDREYRRLRSG